jgi:hypothetical protein
MNVTCLILLVSTHTPNCARRCPTCSTSGWCYHTLSGGVCPVLEGATPLSGTGVPSASCVPKIFCFLLATRYGIRMLKRLCQFSYRLLHASSSTVPSLCHGVQPLNLSWSRYPAAIRSPAISLSRGRVNDRNKLWNKENGVHDQCHGQGLGKISRWCFLAAAANAAGAALARPALAERLVRPGEGLDSADVQSQSARDPNPLTVSCPDCCRALSDSRDHV